MTMHAIVFTPNEAATLLRAGLQRLRQIEDELRRIDEIDGRYPHNSRMGDGLKEEEIELRSAMGKLWKSSS